jgi:glycosyltransferase involved in cell wall biosynthesis
MRVVVAAYACRPNEGSEQGAAWNLVSRLAERHEVWVVTRARHRAVIEDHLSKHPVSSLTFVYHDVPWLLPLKQLPGGLYMYHYLWHLLLARLVANLHHQVGFEVAHHLTFGSFRYPSGLRKLGVPLVMGPLGGAEESPVSFWQGLGFLGFATEALRRLSNRLALVDPCVRSSYRAAAVVLAVTELTRRHLVRIAGVGPIEILPQIGVDPIAIAAPSPRPPDGRVKVLYVGRLIPWKGAHLALVAFARARVQRPDLDFTILGEGPQAARLRRSVLRDEIADVHLLERLPKIEDVYRLYRESDIFLFPSLHDSGGMAVLEAMAAGLPVVCLDLGGPAISVTPECGVVVPAKSPAEAVESMAAALLKLAERPDLRSEMGEAARRRVLDYSWDQKVAALDRVYRSLRAPSD